MKRSATVILGGVNFKSDSVFYTRPGLPLTLKRLDAFGLICSWRLFFTAPATPKWIRELMIRF